MFNRLLFTIATVACLTGAYTAYAILTRSLVVVPELPETSQEQTRHAIAHRPAENVRIAEKFLAEQPWAAQSQYMLRMGQSFVYTKEFKHTPGDQRIRFIPFAMVWLQTDKDGQEKAVSLVSDSALIKFASTFDDVNPNPGRVVGAVLDGDVQIKGPDGLEIVGNQFVFDESAPSLVSTNPVKFWYGSHAGRGRTLNMKLIPAEGPPGAIAPMCLAFGRSVWEVVRSRPSMCDWIFACPQKGEPKLVHVQCSGNLEYDIAAHTATLSKSVRAYSWTSKTDFDSLDCEELWMQFEPAPKIVPPEQVAVTVATPPPVESSKSYQKIETDLAFRRMIATGPRVLVRSTQNNLRAMMKRLEYDSTQRRMQMTDPGKVFVSFKGSALTVPDIEVVLDEGETLKEKEVFCRGVGRLERIDPETNEATFVATWSGHLRKSNDAATGLDLIELQKQASFRQPKQHTALGAEVIRLWLAPLAMGIPDGVGSGVPQPPAAEPQPKRLVAERNVGLASPQLEARTNELEVRFDEAAPRVIGQQSRNSLQLVSLETPVEQAAERRPREQPDPTVAKTAVVKGLGPKDDRIQKTNFATSGSLGPPIDPLSVDNNPFGKNRSSDSLKKPSEPLEVTADWIGVRMRRIPDEPQPELVEVETQGHVKVVQRFASGEAPMTADGDRLHFQNLGENRQVVHLFGEPAHLRVKDRGMHVEGREVHLDRDANRVWVKGKGLLQLPVPPGTQIESLGGASNDRDLDVWWQESMVFDGLTAKFIGKVRAELGLSTMRCEQMNVTMSSRISFTDPKIKEQPELDVINCREDVSFESTSYEGNKLIRVQRGRVSEFTLERAAGTSFAQGPGQMQVLQRANGSQPGQPQRDVIQANRPISAETSEWNFTRVDFKGRMTGHLDPQLSIFHDSVMIVHGPVKRTTDTIDPDHLPPEAGSMRCERLEFSHQAKGPNQAAAYQQLVGKGNARIEGRGFYANADEISFDGSKGLYMLRAHGNQSATIAQDTKKGPRDEYSGRRIEFIPTTKTVKVDWANGGTGSPP